MDLRHLLVDWPKPSWGGSEYKHEVKYEKLERELSALPGVEAVGFSTRGFLQLVEMVKSLLFGVDRSTNFLHMAGAALVLLLTAALAGIAPALRASRVSPLAALRCD